MSSWSVKVFGGVAVVSAEGIILLGGAVVVLGDGVSAGLPDPHAVRINSAATNTAAAQNRPGQGRLAPDLLNLRCIWMLLH
ncbi:hypothetical protein [Arthrobacter sp. TB 26]|uniref:hypothetical protein n=1 Tax=Arthrobacter sp. TB 26 TaxID=494420 RepID=UPI000462B4AC|nr:hypothetical protein [Arthrobacter sp. TB 26]